jgi:hypothetical protein
MDKTDFQNCDNCIYLDSTNKVCKLWSEKLPKKRICTQFIGTKTDGLELTQQTSIRREDVEKMIIAAKVLLPSQTTKKKMRVIIEYDPQKPAINFSYFTAK